MRARAIRDRSSHSQRHPETLVLSVAFFRPGWLGADGKWRFDSRPIQRSLTIDGLRGALSKERPRPADKRAGPAWSPTLYAEGASRGWRGVVSLSCLVLDYDDGTTVEQASKVWLDWHHFGHTSYTNSAEKAKFRIVLPFEEPVPVENWPAVWGWAQRRTGRTIDKACKDAGRMYFLPVAGAGFAAWEHPGPRINLSHLRPVTPPPQRVDYRPRAGTEYDTDPGMRIEAGMALGGKRRGNDIIGVECPFCHKPDVYWHIYPTSFTGWMCKHRGQCDKTGSIASLLRNK